MGSRMGQVTTSRPLRIGDIPPAINLRERFKEMNARPLRPGDLIRTFDGQVAFIQYVNSSGAYAVPLAGVNREIKGQVVVFNAGGRTISACSAVEHLTPLALGGNSQEYHRYVRMLMALREGGGDRGGQGQGGGAGRDGESKAGAGRGDPGGPEMGIARQGQGMEGRMAGTNLGEFDTTPAEPPVPAEVEAEANAAAATADPESAAPSGNGNDRKGKKERAQMAKRSKGKANGAVRAAGKGKAKRDAAPKTVRACVCGCGGETTGHFVPGHDARYHGWLTRLADGRIQKNGKDAKSGEQVVPAGVLSKMGLVAKGDGFKASTPEFYKDK